MRTLPDGFSRRNICGNISAGTAWWFVDRPAVFMHERVCHIYFGEYALNNYKANSA
jgi:hypothetical protein